MRKCSYLAYKIIREYKTRKKWQERIAKQKAENSVKKDENKK